MQFVVLVLVYLISTIVNHRPLKKKQPVQVLEVSNRRSFHLKQSFVSALIGISSVMALDLLSQGDPLWPALALVTVTVGEIYVCWKVESEPKSGVSSYFGGILYLSPTLALICLGLALEIGLVGKNYLLAILVFIGLVPVLIWYSQMNPVFLWAALTIELLVTWGLKTVLWNTIKTSMKNI
jgi:glycerol-3-phosphate acyltransferase PlsY